MTKEQLQTAMFGAGIFWITGADGKSIHLFFRTRRFGLGTLALNMERLWLRAEGLQDVRSAQGELKRVIDIFSGKRHLLRLQALHVADLVLVEIDDHACADLPFWAEKNNFHGALVNVNFFGALALLDDDGRHRDEPHSALTHELLYPAVSAGNALGKGMLFRGERIESAALLGSGSFLFCSGPRNSGSVRGVLGYGCAGGAGSDCPQAKRKES